MAEFNDEFLARGFRAPAIEKLVPRLRAANAEWFAIAERSSDALQRCAARAAESIQGTSLDPKVVATLIVMRAAGNFQGALIVAERGMNVESRTLIRSCTEASLCLAALHDSPDKFIEMLRQDDAASRKAQARFLLDNNTVDPEETERLLTIVEECAKTRNLQLQELSALGAYHRKYLFYRILSHDAGHVSARSLHRHMVDADGGWTGYTWGPEDAGPLAETLHLGVLVALGLGVAFTNIVGDAEGNKDFAELSELQAALGKR